MLSPLLGVGGFLGLPPFPAAAADLEPVRGTGHGYELLHAANHQVWAWCVSAVMQELEKNDPLLHLQLHLHTHATGYNFEPRCLDSWLTLYSAHHFQGKIILVLAMG